MLLRGEVSKIATFGRKPIFTRFDSIDAGNILEVMSETFPLFTLQRVQVRHLYDYYRGKQRIFGRQKPTRPEINNKIVVNHANEIVSFQVSYLLAEPIKYVIRSTEVRLITELSHLLGLSKELLSLIGISLLD